MNKYSLKDSSHRLLLDYECVLGLGLSLFDALRESCKPKIRRAIAVDETVLKRALKACLNKPLIYIDRGP